MKFEQMTRQQQFDTLRNMQGGGHFASALSVAWMRADAGNSARLAAAFPDLVERYGAKSEAPWLEDSVRS